MRLRPGEEHGRLDWGGGPLASGATRGLGSIRANPQSIRARQRRRVAASGLICPSFLKKTPGPFASDPVWLRLAAGVCAQECAQLDPGTLIPLAGRLQYQPPP